MKLKSAQKIQIMPISLGFVNAYLLKSGKGFYLIDTGVSFSWGQLKAGLDSAGCRKGMLKLVILTHGDLDHTGNANRLREEYHTKVAIHASDLPLLKESIIVKRAGKGIIDKLALAAIGLLGLVRKNLRGTEPDILLKDGQSVLPYGLDAKVIHIPGHTPGSIAILLRDGSLFAGDMLVNNFRPVSAVFIQDAKQVKASMVKLSRHRIAIAYPGHGKPISGEDLRNILAGRP